MELLGRMILLSVACLFLSGISPLTAQAKESAYPIVYEVNPANSDSMVAVTEVSESYEVVPGDSLWKISERLWGDGRLYGNLAASNRDLIKNPSLIYPGMVLQTGRTGYIRRDSNPGVSMGEYRFGTPYGWTVVFLEEGGQWANFALSGRGLCYIACLIQDREDAAAQTAADWEACSRLIADYAKGQYPDAVSDLAFEHYRTKQEEELYLYSYTYHADLSEFGFDSGADINVCAGLRLTEHIQAEFIGFAYDYDIHGAVRYVTADFEELPVSTGDFTVNDSNMAISPAHPWELEGLFNPFPWVEGFVDSMFRSATGAATGTPAKDTDTKKMLLDRIHTYKGR